MTDGIHTCHVLILTPFIVLCIMTSRTVMFETQALVLSFPRLPMLIPCPGPQLTLCHILHPTSACGLQFSGFVADSDVGVEAAALQASHVDTVWSAAIEKSHGADHTSVYTVAEYNSPFEFDDRVNEIWMLFDMEDDFTMWGEYLKRRKTMLITSI